MKAALDEARKGFKKDEVPVGAVVVWKNKIVARAYNQMEMLHDPTAHAEIIALTQAAAALENWHLNDCTIYVTLEPCAMCMGAMMHARLARVVFGAHDPKTGVCGSVLDLPGHTQLNHQTTVAGGIHADACSHVLRQFFIKRRSKET